MITADLTEYAELDTEFQSIHAVTPWNSADTWQPGRQQIGHCRLCGIAVYPKNETCEECEAEWKAIKARIEDLCAKAKKAERKDS